MAGYTKQVVISGVKAIDNWFSNRKGAERDWNELRKTFTLSSEMIPDERFIEICKDIGFAPKYQYQLLLIIFFFCRYMFFYIFYRYSRLSQIVKRIES